jgi:hypothetical protein
MQPPETGMLVILIDGEPPPPLDSLNPFMRSSDSRLRLRDAGGDPDSEDRWGLLDVTVTSYIKQKFEMNFYIKSPQFTTTHVK